MKKAAGIILLVLYGSTTMGATVYSHYCMNEFVSWSLFNSKDEKCGKCGMQEKGMEGCCKDEHKQYKLKTDHQKAGVILLINLPSSVELAEPFIVVSLNSLLNITVKYPSCNAPPYAVPKKLTILHCVFLI